MVKDEEVYTSLKTIIKHKDDKALNYAINYAVAGLNMTGRELYIQCLYVLGNIPHWRKPEAKEVRRVLKQYCEENKGKP